ncbi:MAG TPA: hypothetical protein VGU23_05245 [Acidobacteriaceae bacterium]|nr:hypothetical protein [Acidobacteriaceae bacterium]
MPELSAEDESHEAHRLLVRVASRLCVAYLLFWVIADFTVIPREFLSVVHYVQEGGNAGLSALSIFKTSYLARYYILSLAENVLRIALWLLAAGWFYRCGPRIASFFASADGRAS